nr:Gag-Pol polyprotein [Tanacetum cinerariifolium]
MAEIKFDDRNEEIKVEPKTYKEALTQACWIEAMQEELHEFERLEVWELVPRPDKVMEEGIDFEESFAPTIKSSGGMMCQGMRKEIQTKGVIDDSIHFDTLGDMQEFVKMLVGIITQKTMKLARILDLLYHVILQSKVRCLNNNRGNRNMATIIEQQTTMDESLFPSKQRLRIGRSNFRLPSDIQSKEATLQVVYDVLRNSPLFRAFQVTADVPEIY